MTPVLQLAKICYEKGLDKWVAITVGVRYMVISGLRIVKCHLQKLS